MALYWRLVFHGADFVEEVEHGIVVIADFIADSAVPILQNYKFDMPGVLSLGFCCVEIILPGPFKL